MPVHVVIGVAAARRDLLRRRLQFLQANDVGAITLEPVAKLRFARANPIDIPSCDLHDPMTLIRGAI